MEDDSSSSPTKIPSRIVLRSSSTIPSLSERFAKLRSIALPHEQRKMAGPRDPRNFLYDDYYETNDAEVDEPAYEPRSRGTSIRRPARRNNDVEMEFDDLRPAARSSSSGILNRRRGDYDSPLAGGRQQQQQSRRFANAIGISGPRVSHDYDDLDFGLPPRARAQQRVVYRDHPPVARVSPIRRHQQVIRRRVVDDYDDVDLPARGHQVVEVVERVRRVPQRRVQIVKKVPIRQRVVKKIIVQKIQRPSFTPKRRQSNGSNNGGGGGDGRRIGRVQKQRGGGNVHKKTGGGGAGGRKKDQKPKLSASELDRELDEYMRGNKHPRIN